MIKCINRLDQVFFLEFGTSPDRRGKHLPVTCFDGPFKQLSDRRENRTFQDLELEDNLKQHDAETRCGLLVVDLNTFDAPHWLRFGGIVKELYDVGVLPGIIRPMAVGFKTDEVKRYLSFPEDHEAISAPE